MVNILKSHLANFLLRCEAWIGKKPFLMKCLRYLKLKKIFLGLNNILFRQVKEVRTKITISDYSLEMFDSSPTFQYKRLFERNCYHEPALTQKFLSLFHETHNPRFCDIGAHLGYFTLLGASAIRGKGAVFSFEPNPGYFDGLKKNIHLNQLEPYVQTFSLALSDTSGFVRMTGPSRVIMRETQRSSIEMIPFDRLNQRYGIHPNIVKIDVHGAEGKVLKGMQDTLTRDVKHIFCELHQDMQGYSIQDIIDLLTQAHFHVVEFTNHRKQSGGHLLPIEEHLHLYNDDEDKIIYGYKD